MSDSVATTTPQTPPKLVKIAGLHDRLIGGPGQIEVGMWVACLYGSLPKGYGPLTPAVIESIGPKHCKVKVHRDPSRYIPHDQLILHYRSETAEAYGPDPRDVPLPYLGRYTNPRTGKWLPRYAWVGWTIAQHLKYAAGERQLAGMAARAPTRLVIVSCGGKKGNAPTDAHAMYLGSYHQAARRAADALAITGSYQMILSARYGLLDLHDVIRPYDLRMGQPGSVDPDTIRYQASQYGLLETRDVIVLGGKAYADVVSAVWPNARRPLDGTAGMGPQLQRLAAIAKNKALALTLDERIAAVMAAGGRDVDGVWRPTREMTVNCTGVIDETDHDGCGGWTVPTLDRRECWCPCHDEHRPPYEDARAAAERATAPTRRRATPATPAAEQFDITAWLDATAHLLADT